jgi:hypothetical protein
MSAFITQAFLLPEGFPQTSSAPRFRLGDRVRFIPLPAEAFGTITGLQYAPAEHLQAWSWRYSIWLDPQSPGSTWTCADLAWEDDLELLVAVTAPSTEQPA